ncbi:hypothetical protein YC2023_029921 [Brassica napus]
METGKCSSVVEARLLRFWEARNVKCDGELSLFVLSLHIFEREKSNIAVKNVGLHNEEGAKRMFDIPDDGTIKVHRIAGAVSQLRDLLRGRLVFPLPPANAAFAYQSYKSFKTARNRNRPHPQTPATATAAFEPLLLSHILSSFHTSIIFYFLLIHLISIFLLLSPLLMALLSPPFTSSSYLYCSPHPFRFTAHGSSSSTAHHSRLPPISTAHSLVPSLAINRDSIPSGWESRQARRS